MKPPHPASLRARAVVAASLLLLVAGCSKKGPECEAIVKVVNPAVEKLTRAAAVKAERADEHIKAMGEVARITEGAAADLAKIPLTVPELRKASAEYQAMARDAAAAAREVGEAVKRTEEDVTTAEEGAKELEEGAQAFAKACAEPANASAADECRAFGEVMKRYPEDATKTEETVRIVAELDKLPFKTKSILIQARTVIALIRANGKVLADLKAAEATATAAGKRFEAAVAKEDAIVDGMNKLCAR